MRMSINVSPMEKYEAHYKLCFHTTFQVHLRCSLIFIFGKFLRRRVVSFLAGSVTILDRGNLFSFFNFLYLESILIG